MTEWTTCKQLHKIRKYYQMNTTTTLVQPPLERSWSRSGQTLFKSPSNTQGAIQIINPPADDWPKHWPITFNGAHFIVWQLFFTWLWRWLLHTQVVETSVISELLSPRWSHYKFYWYTWVQIIYYKTTCCITTVCCKLLCLNKYYSIHSGILAPLFYNPCPTFKRPASLPYTFQGRPGECTPIQHCQL